MLMTEQEKNHKEQQMEGDFRLLPHIKYPDDLRKLQVDQLPEVCEELRRDIVNERSIPATWHRAWVPWN